MKGPYWLIAALALLVAPPTQGQGLVEMYRAALFNEQAGRIFQEHGLRARPFPPAPVPTAALSVPGARSRRSEPEASAAEAPAFVALRWRLIRRLERSWFENRYHDTKWSYLGSNSHLTPLDTTHTRVLRARLEARFGPPTQTLADLDLQRGKLQEEDYIQFEYWFVVNDSLPVKVIDVDGPFDRGLVIASDQRYRSILYDVRQTFLEEMGQAEALAPYADYYYDTVEQRWYRTGYDGKRYFLERIRGPQAIRGRPLPPDRNPGGL